MTIYVNARAVIERETERETEILLQIRSRPGEPERWELPGGQVAPFEPVLDALAREIAEETGLTMTLVQEAETRRVHKDPDALVETFEPLFAYQTLRGPVDSLGFYFRCRAEGAIAEAGDAARAATWVPRQAVRDRVADEPEQFDWLTRAALDRYLLTLDE